MYNPIHEKLLQISDATHIDEVTLKLALCLFSSFPLNAVLKRLPDRKVRLKCLYIISISAFYLFGILNLYQGFRTLLISTLFTYVITRFYRSKFMPYVNFVFVMSHLAINHMYEQFFNNYDSGKVDITGAQMVLVMKLTSFAWSYYDGTYADKNSLSSYQKFRSIEKHPSLLQFFAYAFFYPSLLTGPSFDYADFETWLNCEIFRDLPESKKPKRRWSRNKSSRRQIPKCGWYALSRVLQGIMWIVLSTISVKYVNIQYALSTAFRGRSFFYKIHYLYFLGLTFRFKYYAAWIISEASCMVCGLGYNGYDAKTQSISWNRVQNIDIWSFEFAQNTRETLEAWNMNTNKWLKYYVYLRTVPKGKKPGFRSTLFTFLTSAFWHGTRPGYYLSFATGALFQTVGKIYRRNFRPIFLAADGKTALKRKVLYDIVCFWVTKLAFGYMVQPFVILDWSDSLYCWGSVYFYIHFGIAVTFALFIGPMGNRTSKFLKRFHASEKAAFKSTPSERKEQIPVSNLDAILVEKHRYEQAEDEDHDMMLGIPDPLEVEIDEAKRDLETFRKQYELWKQEKGLEIEEGNLRHAFLNFKKEFKDTTRRMSFSQYSSAASKSD